jgi:hypothetical protein
MAEGHGVRTSDNSDRTSDGNAACPKFRHGLQPTDRNDRVPRGNFLLR